MARKTRMAEESSEQKTLNELELNAWNEWKDVCRILGCTEAHRESLKSRMWRSAEEKLEFLLDSAVPDWRQEYSEDGWKVEISERFDKFIREGVEDVIGRRLNYKDSIWNIIAENRRNGKNEPELKVIRGKLTARKRVLDGVLECLVKEKGWTLKVIDHKSIAVGSLNEPIGGDDGDPVVEKIDTIPSDQLVKQIADVTAEDRQFIADKISHDFSFVECVLLFTYFKRISFASPIVAEACGVRSSRASELFYGKKRNGKTVPGVENKFKDVLDDLREIAEDAGWSELTTIVLTALERKIKAEKRGIKFLTDVEKAMR